jgi:hypothetical protein
MPRQPETDTVVPDVGREAVGGAEAPWTKEPGTATDNAPRVQGILYHSSV